MCQAEEKKKTQSDNYFDLLLPTKAKSLPYLINGKSITPEYFLK